MRRIHVELGPRSYPVLVGSGLLDGLGELLRSEGLKQTNAFVITNPQVGDVYFPRLERSLTTSGFHSVARHNIPNTEQGKNWEEFSRACAALLEAFPDTGAIPLVFLLGGGVVGDLGGFAAAVFRRGVPFVQIPTTLLAAVDSSVGGKVAVNFGGVKNIMGAFSQPRLVACDLSTLGTLSNRELRSGLAEVIKYGAVCSRILFEQLEAGGIERLLLRDSATLVEIVSRCVQLKADVVEKDELDQLGIRNVLNFGHTVGHALELSADYTLTHGEAISVGMVAAARMALRLKFIDEVFHDRLLRLLTKAGLPNSYPDKPGLFDRIIRAMQMDKKFRNGKNLFVLPVGIGEWEPRENVDWNIVHDCIRSVLI
jgi:3-dehydroquinate synthase